MGTVERVIQADNRSDIVFLKVLYDLLVSLCGHIDSWIEIGKGDKLLRQDPGYVHAMQRIIKLIDVEVIKVDKLFYENRLVQGFEIKVQGDCGLTVRSGGVLKGTIK